MSKKVADAQDREWVHFLYDADFNLVEIREYHPLSKLGSIRAKQTKLVYDANFCVKKILPNYDTDEIVADDLTVT